MGDESRVNPLSGPIHPLFAAGTHISPVPVSVIGGLLTTRLSATAGTG